MFTLWFSLAMLLMTPTAPPDGPGSAPAEDFRTTLDAFVAPLREDGTLSGNLMVLHRGREIYSGSFGMADVEHETENNPETRFCIASLSKPMTALAVVRLLEQGKLSLEDPVSRWIPEFPRGETITLEDLLLHRAGIPHRVTEPIEETRPMTASDIVGRIKEESLLFEPRASRSYSTAGYSVVARILELATGSDYDTAMRALLFGPLGMDSTAHVDSRAIVPRRALPYLAGPEGFINAPMKDMSFLVGGGSLVSTIGDVRRFAQAVIEHELLGDAGWEVFHSRLGWAQGDVVLWSGSSNGFVSFIEIHKEPELTVLFTGNAGLGAAMELRRAIPDIVLGREASPPRRIPEVARLDIAALKEYVGAYGDDRGNRFEVGLDNGMLFIEGNAVHPVRKDWFFNRTYYNDVEFARGSDGRVNEMRFHIEGMGTRVYPRVVSTPP